MRIIKTIKDTGTVALLSLTVFSIYIGLKVKEMCIELKENVDDLKDRIHDIKKTLDQEFNNFANELDCHKAFKTTLYNYNEETTENNNTKFV